MWSGALRILWGFRAPNSSLTYFLTTYHSSMQQLQQHEEPKRPADVTTVHLALAGGQLLRISCKCIAVNKCSADAGRDGRRGWESFITSCTEYMYTRDYADSNPPLAPLPDARCPLDPLPELLANPLYAVPLQLLPASRAHGRPLASHLSSGLPQFPSKDPLGAYPFPKSRQRAVSVVSPSCHARAFLFSRLGGGRPYTLYPRYRCRAGRRGQTLVSCSILAGRLVVLSTLSITVHSSDIS